MEMSRILSTDSSFPGVPLNLASESEMDDSIEQKIVDSKANQTENSASLNSVTAENKEKLILPNSMLILMGILIIIMVGGVVLFLRAKIKMFSSP
jgi:hypothetical protein